MSLSQSMNIALDSMRNNQLALSVVSHNIANINTDGYVRQRVDFSEERYPTKSQSVSAKIKAMNGADLASLTSYVDNSAFKGVVNSASDAAYYNSLAKDLGNLEDVADDLGDNGLNALLNDFYKASANLEQFPSDLSMRQQYVMALDNVCDKFNYITDRYDGIQEDKANEVSNAVFNINTLLNNLADANLAHVKSGKSSSTQGEINAILSELSKYADISYTENPSGAYNLSIAGISVIEGTEQLYELQSKYDETQDEPIVLNFKSLKDGTETKSINDSINAGSLKSSLEFVNKTSKTTGYSTLSDMKSAIESAKTAFKDALNGIQTYADSESNTYAAYMTSKDGELILAASTTNPDIPDTPKDLLVFDSNGKIQVNSEIMENPYNIAAARIDLNKYQPGEDWTKSIGNADNAGFMTALQNEKICSTGGGTNNCTLSQFLINNAAKNGMDLASAENKADLYQGIADSRADDYKNYTGVNLDEELADMIRYQRAFEASAAVFSAGNNILQTIIGMI